MVTSVAIMAYDGCLGSGLTGPADVFKIANTHCQLFDSERVSPLFSWSILSMDGRPVRTSTGITINVDGSFREAQKANIVIIPGIDHATGRELLEIIQGFTPALAQCLVDLHEKGIILSSSCSGSFILAEAGLLDYKRATTSWWLTPLFIRRYPKVLLMSKELVTEDGDIYCSGAITSYLHLCIKLIERFAGKEIAAACAKTTLIHASINSQAPLVPIYGKPKNKDELIQRAIDWMKEHYSEDFNLDVMTDHLAVSKRTFIRRFNVATGKPPNKFLQQIRIDAAKQLLESTNLGIDQITDKVGYNDSSSFRRLFKREVELSPSEYRNRFSVTDFDI